MTPAPFLIISFLALSLKTTMLCFVLRSLNTLRSGRNNYIVEGVRGKRSRGEGRDEDKIREVMRIRSLEKGEDEGPGW